MKTNSSFDVPVLLIMFNRPSQAIKVFERIRETKPAALYLAVDGPRPDRLADNEAVLQCRAIENRIDWPCSVKTLYRIENLGCKNAVSSAISWFFEQVDYGIILEDDCLPEPTFFTFCRDLLLKYEVDERVMHIGGANLFASKKWSRYSYNFTKVCHIWGWATWRRAWKYYDVDIKSWPTGDVATFIGHQLDDLRSIKYWKYIFTEVFAGRINTWDYQWVYAIWRNNGLCILPEYNLITNIGFGESATHTLYDSPFANLSTKAIHEISHPDVVEENKLLTSWLARQLYQLPSFLDTLRQKIERRLKL